MSHKMSCLKQLLECIDVKIGGHQNINEKNIDFKGFVTGYLGQIIKTEAFKGLTTEIKERIRHVYFLANLMCRFGDFQVVLKEYTFVQESIQKGTVNWEDSDYFRIWERHICSEIGIGMEEVTKIVINKEKNEEFSEDSELRESVNDEKKADKFTPLNGCCNSCLFNSSREIVMKKHKLEKHGEKPQCVDCDEFFVTVRAYKIHMRNHVTRNCHVCGKAVLKVSFGVHLKTHSENRGTICITCGKSVINMFNHAQTHKNKDFSCPHCDYKTNVEYRVNLHIQWKHSKVDPVQCPQCGKMIKAMKKSRLELHIKRCSANSSNRERHSCHVCQKTFAEKSGLRDHMRYVHDKSVPKTKCDLCKYQSSSKNNVFMHRKRVHEGKPLREECQYCKRRVIVMSTHISRYHGELTVIQDPADVKL